MNRRINFDNVSIVEHALVDAVSEIEQTLTVEELATGVFRFVRHTCNGTLRHATNNQAHRAMLVQLAQVLLLHRRQEPADVPLVPKRRRRVA